MLQRTPSQSRLDSINSALDLLLVLKYSKILYWKRLNRGFVEICWEVTCKRPSRSCHQKPEKWNRDAIKKILFCFLKEVTYFLIHFWIIKKFSKILKTGLWKSKWNTKEVVLVKSACLFVYLLWQCISCFCFIWSFIKTIKCGLTTCFVCVVEIVVKTGIAY